MKKNYRKYVVQRTRHKLQVLTKKHTRAAFLILPKPEDANYCAQKLHSNTSKRISHGRVLNVAIVSDLDKQGNLVIGK